MNKKNNKQKEEKELPPLMGPPKKNLEIEEKTKSNTKQNKSNFHAETMPKANEDIVTEMVDKIGKFKTGLREYQIKDMVNDTKSLGEVLAKNLKTNQVRKFLDAVNRLKAQPEKEKDFEEIKSGVQLLRPQLAYAAARQKGAVGLQLVMEAAINQINEAEDFTRFVQLTESIIAYHKAAGGRD